MLRYLNLGLVIGLCVAGNVRAHSPEDVAARCADVVERTVERAASAAAEETRECVRRINAMQEQGRDEAAAELARQCIAQATQRTQHAARYVRDICDECIEVLLCLDAPHLARRIDSLGDEAIETLRVILERERNAILEALDD